MCLGTLQVQKKPQEPPGVALRIRRPLPKVVQLEGKVVSSGAEVRKILNLKVALQAGG